MAWGYVGASNETFTQLSSNTLTWADATASNTTTRNTSRFILLSPVRVSSTSGVNFAPFVITSKVGVYGPSFYISDYAPVALCANGDATI